MPEMRSRVRKIPALLIIRLYGKMREVRQRPGGEADHLLRHFIGWKKRKRRLVQIVFVLRHMLGRHLQYLPLVRYA